METFLENTEVHFEMTIKSVDSPYSRNRKIDSDDFGTPTTNEEAIEIAKKIVNLHNDIRREWEDEEELVNVQRVETKVIDLFDQTNATHQSLEKLRS